MEQVGYQGSEPFACLGDEVQILLRRRIADIA
jgi:hypothetical protein